MEDAEQGSPQKAATLCSEFEDCFRRISYTLHPRGIEGEAAGKSSNLAWVAKELVEHGTYTRSPPLQEVIVTVLDCEYWPSPQFVRTLIALSIHSGQFFDE